MKMTTNYEIVEVKNETCLDRPDTDWDGFEDGYWVTAEVDGSYKGATEGPFDDREQAEASISESDETAKTEGRIV
jgi:hypothetical protein